MVSESYQKKIKDSVTEKFGAIGVDEDTINELVSVSIESLNDELSKIDAILNGGNIKDLGIHTHTIKGILLNVGLEDDANQFKEIKHLFEEGKTEDEIKQITLTKIEIFK
jgi:HPt (histidine-containing phosphotransfer) domain-containing protein